MSSSPKRKPWARRRADLEPVREQAREAVEAILESGTVLQELLDTRDPGCCAICGRRARTSVCARADCRTEYERLYQADRRERRYALRRAR